MKKSVLFIGLIVLIMAIFGDSLMAADGGQLNLQVPEDVEKKDPYSGFKSIVKIGLILAVGGLVFYGLFTFGTATIGAYHDYAEGKEKLGKFITLALIGIALVLMVILLAYFLYPVINQAFS